MLEMYFDAVQSLERLRSCTVGTYLDGFAQWLHAAGYSKSTSRKHLYAAAHLGNWLNVEGIAVEALDEIALDRFRLHLPVCRCPRRARNGHCRATQGARHFVAYLRDHGTLAPLVPSVPSLHDLIVDFERWMRLHRGVTESTLRLYRPQVAKFLEETSDLSALTAAGVRQFISKRTASYGKKWAQQIVSIIRVFLRFLAFRGKCSPHLVDAVPSIAHWRLATLPSYLPMDEVEKLLSAPDVSKPAGRRDLAILLLLARLGLRAGEVASLRIGDLDWNAATILVTGKSRRPARLPLPQDVGDAILAYLENGRPAHADDHVFLRLRAPMGCISGIAIACVVNATMARAGIKPPRPGAHVLRHTAATSLLRQGLPLASIGVILRHRSIETTAHYAKVDIALLSQVAQPWPIEVATC